jgi:four helix bundle protein
MGQGQPWDMSERLFEFAVRVLGIAERIPRGEGTVIVRKQLAASGTSIGANYEEALGSETRADRKSRLVTARREARESHVWLRIANRKWRKPGRGGRRPGGVGDRAHPQQDDLGSEVTLPMPRDALLCPLSSPFMFALVVSPSGNTGASPA